MAKRTKVGRLNAFTIFEVTVVLAILGVLITIISVSLNRFNEQLKIDQDIHEELNHWMLVRASLWREYYDADSIELKSDQLTIFQPNREIYYKEEDDQLMRKESSKDWQSMNVQLESIVSEEIDGKPYIIFLFPFKNEVMELKYYCKRNKKNTVNNYFESLK